LLRAKARSLRCGSRARRSRSCALRTRVTLGRRAACAFVERQAESFMRHRCLDGPKAWKPRSARHRVPRHAPLHPFSMCHRWTGLRTTPSREPDLGATALVFVREQRGRSLASQPEVAPSSFPQFSEGNEQRSFGPEPRGRATTHLRCGAQRARARSYSKRSLKRRVTRPRSSFETIVSTPSTPERGDCERRIRCDHPAK
jgi:hypothetical protein